MTHLLFIVRQGEKTKFPALPPIHDRRVRCLEPFSGGQERAVRDPPGDRASVAVYFDMEEISPNGSMGDSTVASADKGRAILEAVVDGCAAFVERFKQMDVRPLGGPSTLSD